MFSLLFLFGCSSPLSADPAAPEGVSARVVDGTPDGVGLLAFLNDPATSLVLLDIDVALDNRAATSLTEHRAGKDLKLGTSDDDLFGSIAEADACYWVGESALLAMTAWATTHGFVPKGDDELGVYDGVSFTVDEAEATVAFANIAADLVLDDEVALDRRAVDSILAARPLATALALSQLYYVGGSAMQRLKDAAAVPEAVVDEVCAPILAANTSDVAADFTELLALATTRDLPFAEVNHFVLTGCSPFAADPDRSDLVIDAVWNDAFGRWDWEGLPADANEASDFSVGGTLFSSRLDRALNAIDERVAEGSWDPYATEAGADLFNRRFDLAETLESGVIASPADYVEVDLHVEASEASEDATVLIDLRTGETLAIHEFSGA